MTGIQIQPILMTAKELGIRGVLDQTEDSDDDIEISTKPNEASLSGENGG